MATYEQRNTPNWLRPPVTDADYISPNFLTGADPRYNPTASVQAPTDTGANLTRRPRQTTKHLYSQRAADSWSSFFYFRYRYFYQGKEFFDSLSLGALATERDVTLNIFSAFKEKNVVMSISVPALSGITVTNLSVADRVQPYSDFPLELNITKEGPVNVSTKEGPVNVSGDIVVTFANGRSWVIGIAFTRITVPLSLLDANWKEGVTLSRSFLTSIFQAATMSETRKSLRKIPVRKQSALLTFRDKESALRAWSAARSIVSGFYYFPLYTDESTMSAGNDGYRIYCDVTYRRFEAGQFVLLRHRRVTGDPKGDRYGHQILEVETVEPDGLTLTGDTPEAYELGDRLYPMMKCLPNTSAVAQSAFTDRIGSLAVEAVESWGPDSISLENEGYTPTVLAGLPIFDYRINEGPDTEIQVMHGGGSANVGRGFETILYGQAYQSQSYTVLAEDREAYWDILGFFNYVRGRARAFWVKQYMDLFTLISQVGTTYSFESALTVDELGTLQYLWVKDASGNQDIVQVLGAANTSSGFDIIGDTSTVTDATSASQALAVRQSSDELEENWLTLSAVELSFTVEEIQGIYYS